MARPREAKTDALLEALQAFLDDGIQPSMRELACRALVSTRDAKNIVASLVRAGYVEIKGFRRVHYRNKPVAEYGFPESAEGEAPVQALSQALNAWRA